MRRFLPVAVTCVLLTFPAFAQRGGGHGGGGGMRGGGGGMRGGFSGGGMRGGGFHGGGGGFRGGNGFHGGGFGNRGGFHNGGFRGNRGFRNGFGYWNGFYPSWGLGWWDPFWGDYGDLTDYGNYGYGYPDYGYPAYPYPQPYQAPTEYSPSPGVVIISNQTPPQPSVVEVPPAPQAWNTTPITTQAKKYEQPLYLLAMKDGTIRAVVAYWVDHAIVHYVTMDQEQKQIPLSSLDRSLSERLNRERNVSFQLPG
ncbi:MAG TPA: hypothetical protein VFW44_06515 [Bryobacteraceae bacterium]|nr:hypothetical protein [Bryobacteraceae bacterium]